ncbi:MAG: GNAT family N-acetyltransferase, partial [Gammaproteobacteria bacterium]|nr:GNAT family N-acetyltransferase [Gammaproteobacteria bacterium]
MAQAPNRGNPLTASHRTARVLKGIDAIDADAWNGCANPPGAVFNPFLSHEFLHALEASGSATGRTGWQPFHLVLSEGEQVVGCVPLYLKGHSQGEYVFDHAWAEALHRAGGSYYPKLLSSIPFTPATGRRLLCAERDGETEGQLLDACAALAEQVEVSSLHINFLPER